MALSRPTLGLTVVALALAALALLSVVRLTVRFNLSAGSGPLFLRLRLSVGALGREGRRSWELSAARRDQHLRRLVARLRARRRSRRGTGPPAGPPDQAAARLARLGRDWLARVSCTGGFQQLEVKVVYGAGDAAATGLRVGMGNAVLGAAFAVLAASRFRPRILRGGCSPHWGAAPLWRLEVRCIVRPKLSQAIFAAFNIYRILRAASGKRGNLGVGKGRENGRASDPEPDEDGDVDHQGDGRREHDCRRGRRGARRQRDSADIQG